MWKKERKVSQPNTGPAVTVPFRPSGYSPPRQMMQSLTELIAPQATQNALRSAPPYPGPFTGRGVVIPGGGPRYFPSAWICIRMLRDVGCALPIELWHVGDELDAETRALVEPFGVTCIDAAQIESRHPHRFLNGWPLKSFALLHSGFREVLFLDADNMPLCDPSYLFDAPEYVEAGSVFWPDDARLPPDSPVWHLAGLQFRDEPEVESAQFLVDRQRCWPGVALASWMNNQHAEFWYRYLYGDKDTFHLAWRKAGLEYAMPEYMMTRLLGTMIQHDFRGRPLFQHRHANKWSFESQMLRIRGFRFETRCRRYMSELREAWSLRPGRAYSHAEADETTRTVAESMCYGRWHFTRQRFRTHERSGVLRFRLDGTVEGAGPREQAWSLSAHLLDAILSISGVDGVSWMLARGSPDAWMGQAPAQRGRRLRLHRVLGGRPPSIAAHS